MKIGLISDTHGFFEPKLLTFFSECEEIWHAGDIGSIEVLRKLENFKSLRAVYGNIDDSDIRSMAPAFQIFSILETKVIITHIGGYPGRYERGIKPLLKKEQPDIFISGHSHILKIMQDKSLNIMHLNPGAIGKSGFHQIRTALRFELIGKGKLGNMEILELSR